MAITLTERATKQIEKQLKARGKGLGLKLGVKVSGCSGFAYVLDYADEISDNDQIFEQQGVKVIVAQEDMEKLDVQS